MKKTAWFCGIVVLGCCAAAAAQGDETLSTEDSLFTQFITRGGAIVYWVLIPMSLLTIGRIVELMVITRRGRLIPRNISARIALMSENGSLDKLTERLAGAPDLVSRAVYRAAQQARYPGADRRYLQHVAVEGLHDAAMRILRKVELCNIVGNVAPMVGLFGTVFGMIQAFSLLGISSGQPRPDLLAAKISVALVTTFWGLLIAIPAIALYGVFRTRVEGIVSEAVIEVEATLRQIRLPDQQPVRRLKKRPKPDMETSETKTDPKRARRKPPKG